MRNYFNLCNSPCQGMSSTGAGKLLDEIKKEREKSLMNVTG